MKNVTLLIKPASSLCNLRCRYCFYADAAARRAVPDHGLMTDATADAVIAAAFAAVQRGGAVCFAFQGGEPTLAGLDFYRRFTAKAHQACPPGVALQFSLQTNGLVLNEAWCALFARENFLIGLSMDGTKDIHNAHRVDAAGHGSWSAAAKALALLHRHGVAVNVLCVVTAQCARSAARVYAGLKKLGVRYMQFIPCIDPAAGAQRYSVDAAAYGDFLCRLFDVWYADWAAGDYYSIRFFDDCVHLLLGQPPSACAACGACGGYWAVESDGSVYPCDFFMLDDWRLGQIGDAPLPALFEGAAGQRFLAQGRQKPTECAECRWRVLCAGGCPNDRVRGAQGAHNRHCAALRRFFAHAEGRLVGIAKAQPRL